MIEDIFDHFDKYTEKEKIEVKKAIMSLESLNSTLEKYDSHWKNPFALLMELFNNATGKK